MKRVNKLGFLSLFSLVGLFGFLGGYKELYYFWGFIVFVQYFQIKPDEMFVEHVKNSACIGFFSGIGVTAVLVAVMSVLSLIEKFALIKVQFLTSTLAFSIGFMASLLAFVIAMQVFEERERKGLK